MQSASWNASSHFKGGTLLLLEEIVNFEGEMEDKQLHRLLYYGK